MNACARNFISMYIIYFNYYGRKNRVDKIDIDGM